MLRSQSAADGLEPAATYRRAAEDARLLSQVARGDLRAFEALYRVYHPRLSGSLSNLVRKPEVVEELVNDTLLDVWRKPEGYGGASKAVDVAVRDRLPQGAEGPTTPRRTGRGPPTPTSGRATRPGRNSSSVSFGRGTPCWRRCVALSPDHRAVVDLSYFHDVDYREIAEIMECPVDTVKTRMFYARRALTTGRSPAAFRTGCEVAMSGHVILLESERHREAQVASALVRAGSLTPPSRQSGDTPRRLFRVRGRPPARAAAPARAFGRAADPRPGRRSRLGRHAPGARGGGRRRRRARRARWRVFAPPFPRARSGRSGRWRPTPACRSPWRTATLWQGAQPARYRALSAGDEATPGQVVVIFAPDTTERELRAIIRASNGRLIDGPTAADAYVLRCRPRACRQRSLHCAAHPQVLLAEPIDAEGRPDDRIAARRRSRRLRAGALPHPRPPRPTPPRSGEAADPRLPTLAAAALPPRRRVRRRTADEWTRTARLRTAARLARSTGSPSSAVADALLGVALLRDDGAATALARTRWPRAWPRPQRLLGRAAARL